MLLKYSRRVHSDWYDVPASTHSTQPYGLTGLVVRVCLTEIEAVALYDRSHVEISLPISIDLDRKWKRKLGGMSPASLPFIPAVLTAKFGSLPLKRLGLRYNSFPNDLVARTSFRPVTVGLSDAWAHMVFKPALAPRALKNSAIMPRY